MQGFEPGQGSRKPPVASGDRRLGKTVYVHRALPSKAVPHHTPCLPLGVSVVSARSIYRAIPFSYWLNDACSQGTGSLVGLACHVLKQRPSSLGQWEISQVWQKIRLRGWEQGHW